MAAKPGYQASARVQASIETASRRLSRLKGQRPSRLPMLGTVFLMWLGTRLAYGLVTLVGTYLGFNTRITSGLILSWQRWDVGWYLLISRSGYTFPKETNFFPLYPMTEAAITWLLGDGSGPIYPNTDKLRLLVGTGLSNLALLVGLYAIARLAALDGEPPSQETGVRAVRMTLAYPFALAWTVAYADGYFLAFSALTLLFARRERWYLAALMAALAGLTRPVALILILPLAYEYGRRQGWWQGLAGFLRARFTRSPAQSLDPAWRHDRVSWGRTAQVAVLGAVVAGAVPAGMASFFTYTYIRFGNFFLPAETHAMYWGTVLKPPWWTLGTALSRLVSERGATRVLGLELALWGLFLLVTLVSIRRVPFAYTLYMAGLLTVSIATPTPSQSDILWGSGRYLAAAIPVYLVAAGWVRRRPALDMVVLSCGLMLQGALTLALFEGAPVL